MLVHWQQDYEHYKGTSRIQCSPALHYSHVLSRTRLELLVNRRKTSMISTSSHTSLRCVKGTENTNLRQRRISALTMLHQGDHQRTLTMHHMLKKLPNFRRAQVRRCEPPSLSSVPSIDKQVAKNITIDMSTHQHKSTYKGVHAKATMLSTHPCCAVEPPPHEYLKRMEAAEQGAQHQERQTVSFVFHVRWRK